MSTAELVRVNRAVPEHLREGYDKIERLSKEECVRLWHTLTGKAVEILRQRAQLILRFDREGWGEIGNGHAHYYREIAHGRMLPELFIAIADPALLDRASKLTIPDQERVARNESVKVLLSFNDSGNPYFQDMELAHLAPKHASVVFHGGKICDEAEQIAYLRSKTRQQAEPRIGTLTPDIRRGGAVSKIGNVTVFYPWSQLEACLSARKQTQRR